MANTTSTPDHETYTVAELEPVNASKLLDDIARDAGAIRRWAESIIGGLDLLEQHLGSNEEAAGPVRCVIGGLQEAWNSYRQQSDTFSNVTIYASMVIGDAFFDKATHDIVERDRVIDIEAAGAPALL